MKNKKVILSLIFIISIVFYIGYSRIKINNLENGLENNIRNNIRSFASLDKKKIDEKLYGELYSSIESSRMDYCILEKGAIDKDELEYNAAILLLKIRDLLVNDKERFIRVFSKDTVNQELFKIADNFKDRESINKVYKLVS